MGAGEQKTILLVEDEAITAMAEKSALEKYGYNVITAHSGEEAVAMVEKTPAIDLILMDINLGSGIDGTEAAASILRDHDIPVVFLSSHMEPEVVAKTEKITSYGYVVKNSSITVLDASIKMAFKLFEAKIRERMKEVALMESEKRIQKKLNSILSPTAKIGDLELEDIIDVSAIQTMMDDFFNVTRVPVAVIDLKGKVLVGTGWQDICTKFHRLHPETLKKCIECDLVLTNGIAPGTFKSYLCQNNLWDNATPLIIGGKHMGNIFTGQFFYEGEKSDDEVFRAQAAQYGFDEKEYMAAVRRVPVWKREDIHTAMLFYAKLAHMISSLSFANIGLTKAIEESKRSEQARRASEERLRDILFSMADWVWEVDGNGVYTYSSEKVKDFLGASPEDIIGKTPFDFMPLDEVKRVAPIFSEIVAKRMPIRDLENWNIGRNGERICLLTNGVPILDEKGNLKGYRGVDKDISERKRAEEQLRYLSSVAENISDSITVTDADFGITYINKAGEKIFGYTLDELKGKTPDIFNAEPMAEQMQQELYETVSLGKTYLGESLNRRKDGSIFYCEYKVMPLKDGNGNIYAYTSVQRDITERKRGESQREAALEALRLNEAQLSNAMQMTKSGHWEYDVDMDLFTFNDNFYRIFRTTADAMGGYQMSSEDYARRFCHPDDMALVGIETRAAIASSDPNYSRQIEHRILYADGEIGHIAVRFFIKKDDQGRTIKTYGVNQDISESKRTEQELRESKTLTEAVVENVPLMIFLKEATGLRFVIFNRAGEELLGYDRKALLGKNNLDLFPPEQAAHFMVKDREVLDGEAGMLDIPEEPILTAKKGTRLLHTRKVCIQGADGTTKYLLGISEDITERMQAAEEIKRQLSEKETLFKEVHHRIKNNIASIGGLLSLRLESVTHPEAVAVLQDAVGRVDSMRILYDKLLLSEGYQDMPVKNYMESLASAVIALFPEQAKVKLEMRIADFQLDSKRLFPLGLITNELLTNKMKYAFMNRKTGLISISLEKIDDHVTLTIQDNGKELPASFDINKTKGFGLMLVKMLSQQLGGSFSIKKQKGTMCKVEFEI